MRFSNSALLSLGSLAGSSFFPRGVRAQSFTNIGTGYCKSCSNQYFDIVGLRAETDAAACESKCIACETAINAGSATVELLGFQIAAICECVFNNVPAGAFTNQCDSLASGSTGTAIYNDNNPGTGEICTANDHATKLCYSKVDAVPSSAPSGQPSSKPSESPSVQPSESFMPSESPSDMPSESSMPSESPSSNPSETPSEDPSESPSSKPSESPSDEPSSMPSESPSSMPSESPSDDPSSMPSESPSDEPSSMPSESPSSMPSESPSDDPSSMPSESPSDEPSSEPSSEPSATPSCTPSSAPTVSPSKPPGVNLFYPKWDTGGREGCRNDGDEPDYMELNPTEWLSSSADACCKKFFGGYRYKSCMELYPPDHDDCNVMLWYPDWEGANKGCTNDGQEPYYMLVNHQLFLYNSREECCKMFYDWDYYTCTGTRPELTHGEWFPDWTRSSTTCANDDQMPDYMIKNQQWYFSETERKCCERFFHWDVNTCLGTTYVGSNKWYVDWDNFKCVKDCVGAAPCGGAVEGSYIETFGNKRACCSAKLPWVADCTRN